MHKDIPSNWPRPDMGVGLEDVEPARPRRRLSRRAALVAIVAIALGLWLAIWLLLAALLSGGA